jgi:hypothetical protein
MDLKPFDILKFVSIYHNGPLAASASGSRAYLFTSTSYFKGSGYCSQNTTKVTTSGGMVIIELLVILHGILMMLEFILED